MTSSYQLFSSSSCTPPGKSQHLDHSPGFEEEGLERSFLVTCSSMPGPNLTALLPRTPPGISHRIQDPSWPGVLLTLAVGIVVTADASPC